MKSLFLGLACAGCLFGAPPAAAILLEDVSRQVVGFTTVAIPPLFREFDTGAESSDLPGHFLEAAVSVARLVDLTNAAAEALQESSIALDAGVLRAEGGATAGVSFDVFDPGFPARALGEADTTVSLLFTLDRDSPFQAGVALEADLSQLDLFSDVRPAAVDVRASVLLVGAVTGIVFERHVQDLLADDILAVDDLSIFGSLPADTYLFELAAAVRLEGFEDAAGFATAAFGFDFTVVPEPGSAALLALGLAALGLRGRRR